MFGKMKFRSLLFFSNGFILVLMIIIAGVVYRNINFLLENNRWVTHTYKVIERGEALQKLLIDLETGMRGFLISGKEAFLGPYIEGSEQFDKLISDTQDLVNDNPSQVKLLDEIHEKKDRWVSEIAEVSIAKRKQVKQGTKDLEYLQYLLSTGAGKKIMDNIREVLNELRINIQAKGDQTAEILIVSILKDMVDQETAQRGFLVTGKDEFLEPYYTGQKVLKIHLKQIEQHLAGDTKDLNLINIFKGLSKEWLEKVAIPEINVRKEIDHNTASLKDIASFVGSGQGKQRMDQLRELFQAFIKVEQDLLVKRQALATKTTKITVYTTLYGTLLAFLVALVLLGLLTHNVMRIVTRISESSSMVNVAASEVSRGNINLSQRTEQQASSLEETATSIEEITGAIQQNTNNSFRASELAKNARESAERGKEIVEVAVHSMNEINNGSKKIYNITEVIDEIAFQTNLLALNAAVEAARAGEQGRGFTVVATEVRNLAQRSATAAKEINILIQSSINKIEEGTQLVNQSGNALGEITVAIKEVAGMVIEVAAASQEQLGGIQQINKAVLQLDEITQQNAELVEEAAVASQSMREQALELQKHIAFFSKAKNNHLKAKADMQKFHVKTGIINVEKTSV